MTNENMKNLSGKKCPIIHFFLNWKLKYYTSISQCILNFQIEIQNICWWGVTKLSTQVPMWNLQRQSMQPVIWFRYSWLKHGSTFRCRVRNSACVGCWNWFIYCPSQVSHLKIKTIRYMPISRYLPIRQCCN